MRDARTDSTLPGGHRGQAAKAFEHLEKIIIDGLRHGFFDCTISCEIGSGGKRALVIRAGNSHKFIISEDEVPR